ncbi:hypothetical protein SAPIO_CDS3919 [Scedosporium apiospermum]|uniref:NADH-ubiquinone reductase complex 1 MLRQ subunit n=1 Tax=Pseudallescheria apiosperma TaxID=563466 RepID=A0A084G8W2_PSEDA|nr:uncharacterized protein SAPIO_CDS3919 [Scedosporium apiospermum]KEZ43774.1 hypothetical protein SAPIO_CDS3919 [Scedosporium apiospermum]
MQPSLALRMFRPTGRMMKAAEPNTPGFAGKVKKVPAELWPLAAVVGFALCAAGFSIGRKFVVDKNLRLARQGPGKDEHGEEHH